MLRISLTYISLLIIFSLFFILITLQYPNYHKQFNVSNEELNTILKKGAAHKINGNEQDKIFNLMFQSQNVQP